MGKLVTYVCDWKLNKIHPFPFFSAELQPMASNASVASLVITVETGLSDEEGPVEPSHLGEKS